MKYRGKKSKQTKSSHVSGMENECAISIDLCVKRIANCTCMGALRAQSLFTRTALTAPADAAHNNGWRPSLSQTST